MEKPVCAQKGPFVVDVEEGKTYFYCACGKSANQPFCDGAHQGGPFGPQQWTAEKTGKAYFCGCRAAHTQPMCDGSHKDL